MFHTIDLVADLDLRHDPDHHSLTEGQAAALELALQASWQIDRHLDAGGGLALMVSPAGSRNLETVFYVDGEAAGMTLSVVRDDALEHLGCYGSTIALVTAITAAAR